MFGLARRDELLTTGLHAPYVGSDRVLLAELSLRGRFEEIPEYLFFRRDHSGSSLRALPDPRERITWFDPNRIPAFSFPEWTLLLGYVRAVRRAPLRVFEKVRCCLVLGADALKNWRSLLADFKYAAYGLLSAKWR
jgi:hypothetical protein